jgi:hypothetical protein
MRMIPCYSPSTGKIGVMDKRVSLIRSLRDGSPPKSDTILGLQIFLTTIALFHAWLLQYQNNEGNAFLIGRVSFQVNDPPYMPSGGVAKPLFGLHTFGDWTMALDYGRIANPFVIPTYPSQTPPVGVIFFSLMNAFSGTFGLFLIFTIALALFAHGYYSLIRGSSALIKFVSVIFGVVLTLPTIISFDRGALYFFVFGLVVESYTLLVQDKNPKISFLLFALAASLKPQLLVLSLFLLLQRRYRTFLYCNALIILANLVAFMTFPGSILKSIGGYIRALSGFTSDYFSGLILDSASLGGFIARLEERWHGTKYAFKFLHSYSHFVMLPGLLWLFFVILVCSTNFVSYRSKLVLLLTCTSLIVPASMSYSLAWSSFAFLIFISTARKVSVTSQPFASKKHGKSALQKTHKKGIDSQRSKRFVSSMFESSTIESEKWRTTDWLLLFVVLLCVTPTFARWGDEIRSLSLGRDWYVIGLMFTPITILIDRFLPRSEFRH